MKATHRLVKWHRWNGAHKFERTLMSFRCRFKKDGTLMVWRGNGKICRGAYPPTLFYFNGPEVWEKISNGTWRDSFGTAKKYQFYYTLEKL